MHRQFRVVESLQIITTTEWEEDEKKTNKSIISYNLFTLRQKTGRHYFYRAHSSYCHYNKQWIMYSVSSTGCCTQMVDVLPMT